MPRTAPSGAITRNALNQCSGEKYSISVSPGSKIRPEASTRFMIQFARTASHGSGHTSSVTTAEYRATSLPAGLNLTTVARVPGAITPNPRRWPCQPGWCEPGPHCHARRQLLASRRRNHRADLGCLRRQQLWCFGLGVQAQEWFGVGGAEIEPPVGEADCHPIEMVDRRALRCIPL